MRASGSSTSLARASHAPKPICLALTSSPTKASGAIESCCQHVPPDLHELNVPPPPDEWHWGGRSRQVALSLSCWSLSSPLCRTDCSMSAWHKGVHKPLFVRPRVHIRACSPSVEEQACCWRRREGSHEPLMQSSKADALAMRLSTSS